MTGNDTAPDARVNVRHTRFTGTRAPLPVERPTFRPYVWRDPNRRPDPRLLSLWDKPPTAAK